MMTTKRAPDPTVHELTLAEINRQVREFNLRRDEATKELAAIFAARKGGVPEPPQLNEQTKAARVRAIEMLNGHASAVLSFPATVTREQTLFIERDAIDLVLHALRQKEIPARAAAVAQWVVDHKDEWRGLAREIVLSAAKLVALEERARQMLAGAGDDVTWIRGEDLALLRFIGGNRSIFGDYVNDDPLREPIKEALAERIVTETEIRKASDVG